MKKAPKYLEVVQSKSNIIAGTYIIPAGTIGTVVYTEKNSTEVNVDWEFANHTTCWVNIRDIRKQKLG